METQHSLPHFQLAVSAETLPLFTTVLQSGIEIKYRAGISIALFLNDLPGFTADYVGDVVQTIFLNGTAVDDLTTLLEGETPILALSAAMPGLAGAIFRKNSFHSALRTTVTSGNKTINRQITTTVTLKLFNTIARERGIELLKRGVSIKSGHLLDFFKNRSGIIKKISEVRTQENTINTTTFLDRLTQSKKVNIRIVKSHG